VLGRDDGDRWEGPGPAAVAVVVTITPAVGVLQLLEQFSESACGTDNRWPLEPGVLDGSEGDDTPFRAANGRDDGGGGVSTPSSAAVAGTVVT
jgi:hypothetical protein